MAWLATTTSIFQTGVTQHLEFNTSSVGELTQKRLQDTLLFWKCLQHRCSVQKQSSSAFQRLDTSAREERALSLHSSVTPHDISCPFSFVLFHHRLQLVLQVCQR
jgi:hypothetical protein